jgi:hypothetical protein
VLTEIRGVFSLFPQYVDRGEGMCCSQTSVSKPGCSCFGTGSGRNHKEKSARCMVSFTTPTRSLLNAYRSASLRSFIENPSSVLAASYFLL